MDLFSEIIEAPLLAILQKYARAQWTRRRDICARGIELGCLEILSLWQSGVRSTTSLATPNRC